MSSSLETARTSVSDIPDTPHARVSELLSQASRELKARLSGPASEHAGFLAAVNRIEEARQILDGYDDYAEAHSSPHPAIVDNMLKESDSHDWETVFREGKTQFPLVPQMSAGGYEGMVLQHFVRMSKTKTILEIGMFTGTTTVSLALLPTVEKVTTLDIEPYLRDFNMPHFQQAGVADKIGILIGDALRSLDKLDQEKATFDMIFVDAHKPSYTEYLNRILSSGTLLAKGGVIVVDNVAFKGSPWIPDARYKFGADIHEFNESARNNPDVDVVMLTIEDGISLIRRKGE